VPTDAGSISSEPGEATLIQPHVPAYARVAAAVLLALVAVAFVATLLTPSTQWVQSDYAIHLPRSTRDGVGIHPAWDLLNTIVTSAGLDQRGRLLGYFIITLDQKLRLWLYQFIAVPPALNPILWILHGGLGPFLLFRFVRRATDSVAAGWIAVAIYGSSPGFLYVFTMNWVPQKALVSLAFIAVLWLASRIDAHAAPGPLFYMGPRGEVLAIFAVMLAAFLSDEYGFLAPALIAIFFWWRFVPSRQIPIHAAAKQVVVLLSPAIVFAILMLVVVPILSEKLYHVRFDYLAALRVGRHRAATVDGGAWLKQAFSTPLLNLVNIIGISLLPYRLTGLSSALPRHFGVQTLGFAHLTVLPIFAAIVAIAVRSARSESDRAIRQRMLPALVGAVVLVFAISTIALAHVPRLVNGFYYGAPIAVAFAILIAYVVRYSRGLLRVVVVALAFWIATIQFQNFNVLNGILSHGSDAYIARLYAAYLPMRSPEEPWTYRDLHSVLSAAHEGQLDRYLDHGTLPPRLFYVVAEQCTIAPALSRRCDQLLTMLTQLRGSP
jgi:hypothetical protein